MHNIHTYDVVCSSCCLAANAYVQQKDTGSSEINYWEISLHITRGFSIKIPRAMHAACSTYHEFSRYCNTEPRDAIISTLTSLNLSFT